MALVFFLLWMIFNGRITGEIILFGLIFAIVMFAFMCKFLDYSLKKEALLFRLMPLFFEYLAVLIMEIAKANLATIRLIISSRYMVEPAIVHFHTDLKTELAKVILANSITLTPGTITVSLSEDELVIHCLDRDFSRGLTNSIFVKLLRRMEELEEKYNHAS